MVVLRGEVIGVSKTIAESDMENNKIIRMSITFYGSVQGVGFRYRAKYAADGLGLTGWVENEWDDTVRMEVQG